MFFETCVRVRILTYLLPYFQISKSCFLANFILRYLQIYVTPFLVHYFFSFFLFDKKGKTNKENE